MNRVQCCLLPFAFCLSAAAMAAAEEGWRYDAKGHCDPFFPLVQDGKAIPCATNQSGPDVTGPLQLGGILWDPGGHSIALINGTEVKLGETVEGYQVSEIRQDAVVLTRDGQQPVVLQISYDEPEAHAPTPQRGALKGGKPR